MITMAQIFGFIKVNFGRFFLGQNFAQIIGPFFLEKKIAQCRKISANLVTLLTMLVTST
jgi:hypothetical protein